MKLMIRRIICLALLAAGVMCAESRIVLLVGAPGSGKTTQTAFIQKNYGFGIIAVDDLIKNNPDAFNKRKASGVDHIEPHSDMVLNQLVKDKLKSMDLSKGVILDGYPATKDHADYLVKLVQEMSLPLPIIISLDVPDETVHKRFKKQPAPGETPEILEQRLKDFHREMDFIQVYFPNAKINKIDADRKASAVSKDIRQLLGKP